MKVFSEKLRLRYLLALVAALAVALTTFVVVTGGGAGTANAAPTPNDALGTSASNKYYAQDPANRLKIWTAEGEVAEEWAFCINYGRNFPGYYPDTPGSQDGVYNFVGATPAAFQGMLSTLARRPLDDEKTYKAIQTLLYVFHQDPLGWRESKVPVSGRLGDYLWYSSIQQAIWHFSDGAGAPQGWDDVISKVTAVANGETNEISIPENGSLEVRSYDAENSWWRFGKQNLISARYTESNDTLFMKLDKEQYGSMTDAELTDLIKNLGAGAAAEGLRGATASINQNGTAVQLMPRLPSGEINWTQVKDAVYTTSGHVDWFKLASSNTPYQWVETIPPAGYQAADPVDFKVTADGSIELQGTYATDHARVIKKSAIDDWSTMWANDGYGETNTADDGYQGDILVVFDEKTPEGEFNVTFEKLGVAENTTTGAYRFKQIAGAEFEVTNSATGEVTPWTSVEGANKTLSLAPGNYVITETQAPSGYTAIDPVKFRVANDGTVTLLNDDGSVADSALQERKVSISGTKIRMINESDLVIGTSAGLVDPVTGAEPKHLNVTEEQMNDPNVELGIVDAIMFSYLPEGKYVAFASVIKNGDENNVVATGMEVIDLTGDSYQPFGRSTVYIPISKDDVTANDGTSFTVLERIYKASDVQWNGEDPVAPLAGATPFAEHAEVDDANQTVTIDRLSNNFELTIHKQGDANQPLAGAYFEVDRKDADGNWVQVHAFTSVADAAGSTMKVAPGEYQIREAAAPAGYTGLNAPITFTVTSTGIVFDPASGTNWSTEDDSVNVGNKALTVTNEKTEDPVGDLKTTVTANDAEASSTAPAEALRQNASDAVTVTDTITYTGMLGGAAYVVEGTLYKVENGAIVGDAIATASDVLMADASGNGEWVIDFGEVAGLETDASYVVYEKATLAKSMIAGEPLVSTHEDPTDKSQTFVVKETKEVSFSKVNLGGDEVAGAQIQIKQGDTVVESWTSEAGVTKTLNLPVGEYTFHEEAAPNGYLKVTDISFTVNADGTVTVTDADGNKVVADGSKLTVTDMDTPTPVTPGGETPGEDTPELKTTVTAGNSTGSDAAAAEASAGSVAVTDTIEYSGLVPNQEFKVTGTLYKVVDGAVSGDAVATKTETLTSSATGAGEWAIDFGNVTLEAGAKYVVFESAVSVYNVLDTDGDGAADKPQSGSHEDPSDQAQTIVVTTTPSTPANTEPSTPDEEPVLKTTVTANGSQGSDAAAATVDGEDAENNGVYVTDTIRYENLIGGKEYTVTARLMDVTGATPVELTSKIVTRVAAESGNGQWTVDFGKVTGIVAGGSYVAFEKATSVEPLIDTDGDDEPDAPQEGTHEDPEDPNQTFNVTPKDPDGEDPNTPGEGDDPNLKTTVTANGSQGGSVAASVEGEDATNNGVIVSDTITYENLFGGKEYTVTARLINVATGAEMATVTETRIANNSGSGTWTMHFGTVNGIVAGGSYVAFERAVSVDPLIDTDGDGDPDAPQEGTHEDPSDPNQTFNVTPNNPGGEEPSSEEPELKTTVKANRSVGGAEPARVSTVEAYIGVQVSDTITYKNLIGGETYTVTARLMEVVNGEAVAEMATVTVDMVADASGSGEWVIDLGKVKGLKEGGKYVVFERAVSVNLLVDTDGDGEPDAPQVGTHEDPNDPSQTVVVGGETPPNPVPGIPVVPGGVTPNNPAPSTPVTPSTPATGTPSTPASSTTPANSKGTRTPLANTGANVALLALGALALVGTGLVLVRRNNA